MIQRRPGQSHPELWILVLIVILLPVVAAIGSLSARACGIVLLWVLAALVADILFVPSIRR
jgi:hypothetical protein